MNEHDDDLASEVIEGEEIETDTFEPEEDNDVPSSKPSDGIEDDDGPSEDASEV